jgi:hypothetical protein
MEEYYVVDYPSMNGQELIHITIICNFTAY